MSHHVYFSDSVVEQSGTPVFGNGYVEKHADVVLEAVSAPSSAVDVIQRAVDFVVACAILLLLFIPFLIVALLIRLDSRGPVLFCQRRIGRNGKEFSFYKFRSMVADAEVQRQLLLKDNEASGPLFKIKNDPRITGIGRFLRKYSIDEFPQLLNVLLGDMSMVGPRPALPSEVEQYSGRQRLRLTVKPGITGLWQVSGRSDLSFERSIELDLEYIAKKSLALYVSIMLRTIPAVVSGKGAY